MSRSTENLQLCLLSLLNVSDHVELFRRVCTFDSLRRLMDESISGAAFQCSLPQFLQGLLLHPDAVFGLTLYLINSEKYFDQSQIVRKDFRFWCVSELTRF